MWGFESDEITYAFLPETEDKKIIYPNDTAYMVITPHWRECLEDIVGPGGKPSGRLQPIYICDTFLCRHNYSNPDSVLMNHNILKIINLKDSSVVLLRSRNFIVQYP